MTEDSASESSYEWCVMHPNFSDDPHRGPMSEKDAREWVAEATALARKHQAVVLLCWTGRRPRERRFAVMENDDPFAATQKIIDDFHDALLEWYRALVRGMTDALRSKGSSTSHQDFPLLGLATTRELLEEVAARMAIQASPGGKRLMYQCQAALSNLHSQVLDYRTVDNM